MGLREQVCWKDDWRGIWFLLIVTGPEFAASWIAIIDYPRGQIDKAQYNKEVLGIFLLSHTSKQAWIIQKNLYSSCHSCLLKNLLKQDALWMSQINAKAGILEIEVSVSLHITFIEHNLYLTLLSANQKS